MFWTLMVFLLTVAVRPAGGQVVVGYGIRPLEIGYIHLGIWKDVSDCLGVEFDPDMFVRTRWELADSLITEEGYKAYGLSVVGGNEPPRIVLEDGYQRHPTVISHEIIHILTKDPNDWSGEMLRCQLFGAGAPLPLRRVQLRH